MLKKTCALMLILASLCAGLFAVPGIKPLVPDVSGQYVYYRDYSFQDETYLGILHYDEGTYAARFYSCKNDKPLKDITIYVSMNASADHIDLTGEKIVGAALGTEDVDILNYLHDFIYEFALTAALPIKIVLDNKDKDFKKTNEKSLEMCFAVKTSDKFLLEAVNKIVEDAAFIERIYESIFEELAKDYFKDKISVESVN